MATNIVKAEFTRPADTVVYTAGDVMSNSTSAGVAMSFPGVFGGGRSQGSIRRILIIKSNPSVTLSGMTFILFNADPGTLNDNVAFANFYTNRDNVVSVVSITNAIIIGSGGSHAEFLPSGFGAPLLGGATVGNLWGVILAAQAYTPLSAEQFSVRLFIDI